MSLSSQGLKCSECQPLNTWPTKTSNLRCFTMRHWWGMHSNMLRTVESQGASIQLGATRITNLNWPVIGSARNQDRTRGTITGGGNIELPYMSKGDWKCSTPRLPEVGDIPKYNSWFDWYMRIQTDSPLVHIWDEMLTVLYEEGGVTQNQLSLWKIVSFHIEIDRYVCWNKSNIMLVC